MEGAADGDLQMLSWSVALLDARRVRLDRTGDKS